jgi:hypothetical protein
MESQVIMKFRFHEIDYGKGFLILHATLDHHNGQLHKLQVFQQISSHNHIRGQTSLQFCCGVIIRLWTPWELLFIVIIKEEACWLNKVGSNRLTTKVPFASLIVLGGKI